MKFGKYDESVILATLQGYADLNLFYIFKLEGAEFGTVRYLDRGMQSWILIIDDNELYIACHEYLRQINAPVFFDEESVKSYEALLKKKYNV